MGERSWRRELERFWRGSRMDKKPWQMTLSEYRESLRGKKVDRGPKGLRYYSREGQIQHDHKHEVEIALQLGRPVPAEVLRDYPNLAARRNPRRGGKMTKRVPREYKPYRDWVVHTTICAHGRAKCRKCKRWIVSGRKAVYVRHGASVKYYHPACWKRVRGR